MKFWKRGKKKPRDLQSSSTTAIAHRASSSNQDRPSGSSYGLRRLSWRSSQASDAAIPLGPVDPKRHYSRPHITGYSPDTVLSGPHTICRCALPQAHGDAFTRIHHAEAANGITFLSTRGQPLSWEEAQHAFFDRLVVDSRVSAGWHREDEGLLRQVYHESTVRQILKYHEVWKGVKRHGKLRSVLEGDVIWWGRVNPKGAMLRSVERPPADGTVVLSTSGPWYGRPGRRGDPSNPGERYGDGLSKKLSVLGISRWAGIGD
ncbi:hypothetical protein BU26DRAFT_292898 [Trematosphaeria pertusa]|uniref:Uncharacterized protein n=1 Tax=Trematosphaeria pertusa TaxID=390896 RepID=A0A6A6IH53_9PLEO|nr:uncharacterized protein BU26DRAFT_292898 [Trematosphaeria pertusa]KAF2249935.1 hypothetical protein BU26DRAFT_292898 [Trematosphaeria pertusa]